MRKLFPGIVLLAMLLLFPFAAPDASAETKTPQVAFHISEYIGHVGRETYVVLECWSPDFITKNMNTFQLRNQRGEVLATAQWHNPASRLTIRFTVPESALGANELSVWWNGVDVTAEHAYAAYSDLSVPRVTQLTPQIPAIALTIVCGGGTPQDVDEILAVLDRHGAKCTFFLSGGWLENHVEAAQRIVAAGHEIGSHGYQHIHMPQMNNYRRMRELIVRMNTRCEELLGVRPRLFRAPFSDTNQMITALARAEGMEEIQWNIDSRDWNAVYRELPSEIVRSVTGVKAVSGSVIQFHLDGYNTAQVLDEIIPIYRQRYGYQVVTEGELLELSGWVLPPLPEAAD